MRRGFHTLKGSVRMVGLMDLGEVAWEIEQVLNLWLEQKWPASAELLELIARGSSAFARWVAQLREGSLTQEIEADDLVELAARLKQVETPAPVSVPLVQPAPALQAVPAADAVPATVPEAEPALDFILRGQTGSMPVVAPEPGFAPAPAMQTAQEELAAERMAPPPPPDLPPDVLVGDVRIAPHLFDIYLKEALQHVAALEAQVAGWRAAPGSAVSPAFERAAHTLASSSRTTGFAPLAELASALEQWTRHAPLTVAASDVRTVVAAVEGLRERIEAVARREVPASVDALEGALRALVARQLIPRVQSHPPERFRRHGRPPLRCAGRRHRRLHGVCRRRRAEAPALRAARARTRERVDRAVENAVMNGDAAFFVWTAYIMGGLLCVAELAALALRYRNIRQHLGWRRR